MGSKTYGYINNLMIITTAALAGLIPIFFLSLTTNYYDIPKLTLLIVGVIILYGLWIISWIFRGKVIITKTPLDIPLLFLLLTVLASVFFSSSRNPSIYGIFPEVHGSAVSWVTYILLYFVTVSNLKDVKHIKIVLYAFYAGAGFIALISILSFFGIFLPFEIAKGLNFSPTGSTFSTVALLLMLLPLALFSSVNRNSHLPQIFAVILSVLFSLTIVLIGSTPVYIVLLLIYLICLYVNSSKANLPVFIIPILTSVFVLILTLVAFPGNKIFELRNSFPQEVQLPLDISWKISVSAFRDEPFLGTGPATYLYNFTSYKPVEFNSLNFWNFTFGTAYNEFLQILGTLGFLGFVSFVILSALIVIYAYKYLFLRKLDETSDDTHILLPALALGGLVSVLLLFIHVSTLVSVVVMLLLLAYFMASQKHIREKTMELSTGIKLGSFGGNRLDILPVIVFILFIIAAVPLSGKIYKAAAADYYHRMALTQADKDGEKTYEYLQKAENLNPVIDLYRVDMAQTNFALANSLASQKGPNDENPQGSLTDQDKQTIQTLITQAINEGRASVALAPRSSRNWQVLALIYRNITGVANNSLAFSLDAYGRAMQLDPLNPALRVNVGLVYYSINNYDMAIRFFTDAVNLKPDYVNGYYNLAVAYREKGDLENAKIAAERTVALLQMGIVSGGVPDELKEIKVQDYNTVIDLLNEIKARVDIGSEDEDGFALQNPDLPEIDVPGLNNPPENGELPEVGEDQDTNLP
jgi:tetratricopeptide (TPR) repeat protein